MSLDLDQRPGWPTELRVLLDRHPRASWPGQGSAEVAFWLEVHDQFRQACVELEAQAAAYSEGRQSPQDLAIVAAPRVRGLVVSLHGHHRTEDFHYFPAFRAAERRLIQGFDSLERDHFDLQRDIAASLTALQQLLDLVPRGGDSAALASRQYVAATSRLCRRLCRHLSDEEDLVVPLLLERGD